MKTISYILLATILALNSSAQIAAMIGSGRNQYSPNRTPRYHYHPQSPLLFETFDRNPGYDLFGWTEVIVNGSIDEDSTSTVLDGTQSLAMTLPNDDPTYVTNSFAARDRVWVSLRLRLSSVGGSSDRTLVRLMDASGNCQMKFTVNNDGNEIKIWPQCSASAGGVFLSLNTTYWVWMEYWNNNGANAYASVSVSTSPIKPSPDVGNGFFTEQTTTSTATQVSQIMLGSLHDEAGPGNAVTCIMDYLLVDDEEIGNYP